MESKIITVSGASGVGKSYLVDKILERYKTMTEIVGITTREKREGEIDGKSSHYLSMDQFKELEKEGRLILIKSFFGNNYAWLKDDLTNISELRIMNISYKSIQELRDNGLNIYSIFVKPQSEEKLQHMLKLRTKSDEEYVKRFNDYKESEKFIKQSPELFDFIFTNNYDEISSEKLLKHIGQKFSLSDVFDINVGIANLLIEDKNLNHQIILANDLLDFSKKDSIEEVSIDER